MKDKNVIYDKSFAFAIKIVHLYEKLRNEKKEFIMSKQILRSGTSIGANVSEAVEGQSKKDFISKLSIGLKEANETKYWINLLIATNYLTKEVGENLLNDLNEIIKILVSILKTSKNNYKSDSKVSIDQD